jgi:two-component system response regulator DctR/two-component system response regulator FixJ
MSADHNGPIFVVAHDPAILRSMQFLLEIQGFLVRAFDDSLDLLALTNWPPQGCLVIEQNMPTKTGLDLLTALRSRGIKLPAILTTSEPTAELRRRAADIGVLRVLAKPLAQSFFVETLREALKRSPP